MATCGRTLAPELAARLGGTVRELPGAAEEPSSFAVALPDGRLPLLLRDFGHLTGISLEGVKAWHESAAPSTALVAEILAATETWSRAHPADEVTLVELALDLAATLAEAFSDRWTIDIPGTPDPSEMWLHGSDREAASVGVFRHYAVVWVDDAARELRAPRRGDLPEARARALAAVREQHDRYERNVALSARLRRIAAELAAGLAERLRARCALTTTGWASHHGTISARIAAPKGGGTRDVVRLSSRGGRVEAHAGLEGRDGWDGDLADLQADLPEIVRAVRRMHGALTLEDLVVGARYRVLEPVGELEGGTVVRFQGFDDVDNHYGRYVFVTAGGAEVAVSGDFSTPHRSPLGEVHRYLEPL